MSRQPWHAMEADAVLSALATDGRDGLDPAEAARRLAEHGYNELAREEGTSPLTLLLNQFKNVLILVLLAAVALSALIGEVVDAAIIAVIVVFCAALGFAQEYRAERALDALKRMLSPSVGVLRGGATVDIPSRELVPGDIVLLEAGDRLAADARLLELHALRCDEAPLTGESVPVAKDPAVVDVRTPVAERTNMAFTGTTVTYGRGRAVVTGTGMDTEFGRIAEAVATIEVGKTPLERRTDEIGKWLAGICVTICAVVAAVSVARGFAADGVDLAFGLEMLMFAVALAVAAVPEALAAIVTGALALGMHAMAKRNAIVRKMPAVETLGCTTVICSDKTGTLTTGEMTIRRISTSAGLVEVTGAGYAPEGEFRGGLHGRPIDDPILAPLLRAGVLCNDSDLRENEGRWTVKGDPTEASMLVAAAKAGISVEQTRAGHPRIEEFPFSSERKRMTTVHRPPEAGGLAFMKGAPEVVLERCALLARCEGPEALDDTHRARILEANEAMALDALRVLAVAYKPIDDGASLEERDVESGMIFLGLVGMMDPPRPEAAEAVQTCQSVRIKPVMITGDHELTAVAIARELGIFRDGDRSLAGTDLEDMPEAELERIVDEVTVYARVSPTDKLKIVRAWQSRGDVVAMTGDGVNDAPALKHADIGVAMGISGTDVAREAADMVLADDNFATIVTAIERGRWIYDNIKKYLAFLLQCNITEVVVIGGIVLMKGPEFLPLLPAAILYLNLATDGLPALALGLAPPERDIMTRPPRDPNESVFGWDVKSFVLRAVLVECPFFYYLFLRADDVTDARTLIFFMFIVVELVIALNCRSLVYSIVNAPPHKWLLIALVWELVLVAALVQIPSIREAFGIRVPSAGELGVVVAFGLAVMLVIEATKVVLRRKARPAPSAGGRPDAEWSKHDEGAAGGG